MQIQSKNKLEFTGISVEKLQFFCLLLLGVLDFLTVTVGKIRPDASEFFVEHFLMAPALLFLGASLTTRLSRAAVIDLILGVVTLVWMALCQCIQAQNWELMDNLTLFWPIYLLVFPFASVTRDSKAQKGLRTMALIAVALSMVMVLFSAMLSVYILPPFLRESVEWDNEGRLAVLGHPNIAGWMFMIGIAFTVGFFFEAKNKWLKLILLGAAGAQLLMQALTNSRTSIILTDVLVGGALFFYIFRGGWKQFVLGMLAAVVLAGSLFLGADAMYDWNHDRLAEAIAIWQEQAAAEEAAKAAAEAADEAAKAETAEVEAEEEGSDEEQDIGQVVNVPSTGLRTRGGFWEHLGSFNGRTSIWKGAFNTMGARPEILLHGTAQVGVTAAEGGCHFGVMHLHNSWIQMLVGFGIPGLLVALYLTFLALRGTLWMLFSSHSSLWQKCVAMLMGCMLLAGFLEPYLFTGYTYCHFITVMAMMCIGYLNHWYRLLKNPEIDA